LIFAHFQQIFSVDHLLIVSSLPDRLLNPFNPLQPLVGLMSTDSRNDFAALHVSSAAKWDSRRFADGRLGL
jgi:hypothetical protein